jgi:hypothetical protein
MNRSWTESQPSRRQVTFDGRLARFLPLNCVHQCIAASRQLCYIMHLGQCSSDMLVHDLQPESDLVQVKLLCTRACQGEGRLRNSRPFAKDGWLDHLLLPLSMPRWYVKQSLVHLRPTIHLSLKNCCDKDDCGTFTLLLCRV